MTPSRRTGEKLQTSTWPAAHSCPWYMCGDLQGSVEVSVPLNGHTTGISDPTVRARTRLRGTVYRARREEAKSVSANILRIRCTHRSMKSTSLTTHQLKKNMRRKRLYYFDSTSFKAVTENKLVVPSPLVKTTRQSINNKFRLFMVKVVCEGGELRD